MFRFVKMMINEEKTYLDICETLSQAHVFGEMIKSMDNNQYWYSNSGTRAKISTKLRLSDVRIKQIIKQLTNLGLLHKKMKGIYIISHQYITTSKEEK